MTPYQASFIDHVTSSFKPGKVDVLVAPVGTGKTFALAEAIAALHGGPGGLHTLILAPTAVAEHWGQALRDREIEATSLFPRVYRLIRERTGPEGPLPPGVYTISVDFGKRLDIRSFLQRTEWDLLVVDDAHLLRGERAKLFAQLRRAGNPAAVLATSTLSPAVAAIAKEGDLTDWGPAVASFYGSLNEATITNEVVEYRRSAREVDFLRDVVEAARAVGGWRGDVLLRLASSSTSALETALLRWSKAEADFGVDKALLTSLLTGLEDLDEDTQLKCALKLIDGVRRRGARHVVVFSEYAETALYLSSALEEEDQQPQLVRGATTRDARAAALEAFESPGGVLVCTPAAVAGLSLSYVEAVVHYDMPSTLVRFAQREGRYRRFSRTTPCIAYFLVDTSDALSDNAQTRRIAEMDVATAHMREDQPAPGDEFRDAETVAIP